jgi:hypothetical protein
MKLISLTILVTLLSACAMSATKSPSGGVGLAHMVTDGAYITNALLPDGRSALPPKASEGDLEPIVALTSLDLRPGKYTITAGCADLKDGALLSVVVDLSASQRYVLRCAKNPLRLVVGA